MKESGKTAASKALTGKHETASLTAQQAAITARKRAAELKKKKTQKRTLYIVFTALAAATIIVVAFILKGAAEQRSYNTYYSNALQDYYSGDYDSALASLRRASSISATEECSMLMVDCYEQQGNLPKALRLLEELYKQDKSNAVVSARIAEIKQRINDEKNESLITVAGRQFEADTSTLSLRSTGLGDGMLQDVVKLYALTSLTLTGNRLSDISPLSSLGGLAFLDLSDNLITDLSPLANLRELKTLYLNNNPFTPATDFSPLYSLPQLEMLSIRGSSVSEEQLKALAAALPNCAIHSETAIETVSEITFGGFSIKTDAEELDLSNMGIYDLSPLSACKGLKKLDITGNSISDLTPLMDLPQLEWLSFKDNTVTDLRPLMGLTALRYVNAEGNGITGTAALSSLSSLSELYLAFNPVRDLSGLRHLSSLRKLGLESIDMTDDMLPQLYKMNSLDVLRIYDNPALSGEAVDELQAQLRGCMVQHSELLYSITVGGDSFKENTTEISLFGRGITDITPLNRFKNLEKLDLGSNEIDNDYMFQYMTAKLKELKLGNNRISDATPLAYLGSLERLDLSGNNISNLQPIKKLTELKWLNLRGNPLTDEQVAELQEELPNCEIIFGDE